MIATTYGGHPQVAYGPALEPCVRTGVERAAISRGDGRTWAQVMQVLIALRSLNDDWDGEGSEAPRPAAIAMAAQVAGSLEAHGAPVPTTATATRSGGILFGWEREADYTEIEVVGPDRVEWMVIAPGSPAMHGEIELEHKTLGEDYS